jgi:predicted PurR-regulated permease PerM
MRVGASGKEWVAIILAIGLATAINLLMFAVLWDALFSNEAGLSENATQIIIAAFGGIIGVLGSFVGYRAAERNREPIDQTGTPGVEPRKESNPP